MQKLRMAVIGVGHLGRHHARILTATPGVELVGVSDTDAVRCAEVAAQCGVPAYEDYRALIHQIDAASIVVPTSYHHEVAAAFLSAGKSLLVEKPLAADVAEATGLVDLARRQGAVLQVGHIERFNPVLGAIPQTQEKPRLIEARRVAPYSFRSTDISVVLDLMIHDLDIVLAVVGELPRAVQASGWTVFGGLEDVVTARLEFAGGTVAQLTASRADVQPAREMTIRWTHGLARLDFAAQRTVTSAATPAFFAAAHQFKRPHPKQIPSLKEKMNGAFFQVTERDWSGGRELLAVELGHFVNCVRTRTSPIVTGEAARDAVLVADTIVRAARTNCTPGLAAAA
jgi:predicted dehydrogenase